MGHSYKELLVWQKSKALAVELYRAAPGHARTHVHLICHFAKQFLARMRIGINEQQPLPARCRRPAVPRPRNLVQRLKNHRRPGRSRNLRRAIGRIVVTDNQLGRPAALGKYPHRRLDLSQRLANQPLFVERGNDDGNFQTATACANPPAAWAPLAPPGPWGFLSSAGAFVSRARKCAGANSPRTASQGRTPRSPPPTRP